MKMTDIRPATAADIDCLYDLYRQVARQGEGLARTEAEISRAYIVGFVAQALERGLIMVVEGEAGLIGSLHAYAPQPAQFGHCLSDLTIALSPNAQGMGLGQRLFEAYIARVRTQLTHIHRIELMCRESNIRALKLYERLGFVTEGRLKGRVRRPDGTFEDDLILGLSLITMP